ncbi:MAG: response regulator [Vicingaceae bacterium]
MNNSPIKIILVDDHQIVREGFKLILFLDDGFEVIGEASSAQELFELTTTISPDIFVLDISMPGMNGIEICKVLKSENLQSKILFLTANNDATHIKQAVKAGADGFLPKDTSPEEFKTALQEIYRNNSYFSQKISGLIVKIMANTLNGTQQEIELTLREIDIIKEIADGKPQKEIAEDLNISPRTVEAHKKNIQTKLQINNTVDLVKYAIREGLVEL